MDRRRLGIAAAVIAVLVAGVAAALLLTGGDDEPAGVASTTGSEPAGATTAAADTAPSETEDEPGEPARTAETESQAAQEAGPPAAPEPDPAPAPAPVRYSAYSASSGDWQTVVPSGGGWGQPVESARASGRVRTSVRGPRRAVLLIDHVPSAAARIGSEYSSKRELSQPWFGSMTEYRLAEGAVGYVLNAGESGPGFRVVATGADPAVARRVANELTYVDL